MKGIAYLERSAEISPCLSYRYALVRRWHEVGSQMLIIGLNPSTADHTRDDPTIRRCVGFANSNGCSTLVMANLFAFRSTLPSALKQCSDPVGPFNDLWLDRLSRNSDIIVAAWGAGGILNGRAEQVASRFKNLKCLGTTQNGSPRHPLYVSSLIKLIPYPTMLDSMIT